MVFVVQKRVNFNEALNNRNKINKQHSKTIRIISRKAAASTQIARVAMADHETGFPYTSNL